MKNFRKLEVWSDARILVKEIYLITDTFPDSEKFGLTSLIKRASVSIPQILLKAVLNILKRILFVICK